MCVPSFRTGDGSGVNYQEINDCPLQVSTRSQTIGMRLQAYGHRYPYTREVLPPCNCDSCFPLIQNR